MDLRRTLDQARREEGFSLVEAMVAMGIFFMALLLLITAATAGLQDIGLARQRQGANGIANQVMEQVRGLAIPTDVARGLSSTDPAFTQDPNIVTCGAERRLRACTGELLVHTPNLAAAVPLVPHRRTVKLSDSPTTYTRSVYITRAAQAMVSETPVVYRAVVIVSWPNPLRRGNSASVETQSLIYQPVGCVDPANNPFAAPCSPFFYGLARVNQGRIDLTGTLDGQSFTSSVLTSAGRADAQVEQIGRVQGAALPSQGTLLGGGSTQTTGGVAATTGVDDDTATSTPEYQSEQMTAGASSSISYSTPSGRAVRVTASSIAGGDTGSSTSAMKATATTPCPLSPSSSGEPNPPSDDLPCGYSRFRQTSTRDVVLDLGSVLGLNLGSARLARIGSADAPSWLLADRIGGGNQDGSMAASASRRVGTVEIGGLPTLIVPPGPVGSWLGYYIRVNPHTSTASAAAGTSTNAPAVAQGSGASIQVWTGLGYSTINLGPAPVQIPTCSGILSTACIAPVVVTDPTGQIRVTITPGTITAGGTSTQQTPAGAGGNATRTESRASVGSPLVAQLNYKVEVLTLNLLGVVSSVSLMSSVDYNVDLGQMELRSGYKAAANV